MKKVLLVFACFAAVVLCAACGAAPSSSQAPSAPPSEAATSTASPSVASSSDTASQIPHDAASAPATGDIAAFAAALDKAGIEYSEGDAFFEMVGALDGRKFYIGGGTAEVYLFDKTSDAYKAAESTGELALDFNGTVTVLPGVAINNGLVLYCDGLDDEAAVVQIFMSM